MAWPGGLTALCGFRLLSSYKTTRGSKDLSKMCEIVPEATVALCADKNTFGHMTDL